MTANDINNGILAGLTKVATLFVQKMKQRLSSGNYPQGNSGRGTTSIQDATSIGTAQTNGDISFIDVNISLAQAPFAAAFEWGSGLHAKRGGAALYLIAAKNADQLHFWWEKGGKWFVGKKLPFGHPGIVAKPYIAPTLAENKAEFRKMIGKELKAAIMLGVPPVTVIEVKL
jgi:hypothetical protein